MRRLCTTCQAYSLSGRQLGGYAETSAIVRGFTNCRFYDRSTALRRVSSSAANPEIDEGSPISSLLNSNRENSLELIPRCATVDHDVRGSRQRYLWQSA